MHSNFTAAVIALLFTMLNHSLETTSSSLHPLQTELSQAYQTNENIILVGPNGKEYLNPTVDDLATIPAQYLNQNRIRVTLNSKSENELCSTEFVIFNESGAIENNYSINTCTSFGWIFFTPSDCFQISLYHDAGQEAPTGNKIKGSVDWTFKFNDRNPISGTYMDGGVANMVNVANPCFKANEEIVLKNSTIRHTYYKGWEIF